VADELGAEYCEDRPLDTLRGAGLALVYENDDVFLQALRDKMGAVRVDFVGGALGYRRAHNELNSLLAKAVGLRSGARPRVWDLTAGLGQDAFALAALGCHVTLFERHPAVRALLDAGLRRARSHAESVEPELTTILDRLHLRQGDSIGLLEKLAAESAADAGLNQPAQVLYLDPMFPPRSKSAKVKKSMQLFHQLVGTDDDSDELLRRALALDISRVVVKRPRHAPVLADKAPSLQFTGKSLRFDVYPFKKLAP